MCLSKNIFIFEPGLNYMVNMKEEKDMNTLSVGENNDIIFSKVVRAGKRIYYLDVKKNSKDKWLITITESKRILANNGDTFNVNYEKHKIFVYPEALSDFTNAMNEIRNYVVNTDADDYLTEGAIELGNEEEMVLDPQSSMDIKIDF